MSMIHSIIENDIYKFSMSNYYQQIYPEARGTFTFRDRNNTRHSASFVNNVRMGIKALESLSLRPGELEWCCDNIPYIPERYWEWLTGFRYDSSKVHIKHHSDGWVDIEVSDRMDKLTLWEVPILAIVSECYYQTYEKKITDWDRLVMEPLRKKVKLAEDWNIKFAAFGMRRRFSRRVEEEVTQYLSKSTCCVGTSTVYFAMKYGLRPLGTMAHELFMATAAFTTPKESNYIVMENWSKVYDGNLGTVLPDTFTTDVFLRNFSMKLAKLYDSVRQDSGDPIEFGEKIIEKYKSYGIDPMSKTIIFSDALDIPKAIEIARHFAGDIKTSFGIGTNITNDIEGYKPMNIVMKLKEFQLNPRQPIYGCVKLSDNPAKAIGHPKDIENYRYQLGL